MWGKREDWLLPATMWTGGENVIPTKGKDSRQGQEEGRPRQQDTEHSWEAQVNHEVQAPSWDTEWLSSGWDIFGPSLGK